MWSIGSITAALLTGDVIFVDRVNPRFKKNPYLFVDLAAECDLSVLDSPYSIWQNVGKRPKDLVKKLLVLDETKRLTATQALAHDWFTNKHYADELDAVYQRSIEGWTPRRKIFRLVEALDSSRLAPDDSAVDGSVSRYFPSETLSPSQPSRSGCFKSSRKIVPASLPKIDEETLAELDESTESVENVQMTHFAKAQDSVTLESFDVQESMSQLAINPSEASTDLLMDDEEFTGDRSYPFDADHEMAVGCSEEMYSESMPVESVEESSLDTTTDSQRSNRKRRSSPRPDDAGMYGVDSLGEDMYRGQERAKRLRVD